MRKSKLNWQSIQTNNIKTVAFVADYNKML